MVLPPGCNEEDTLLILGSGCSEVNFYPDVIKYKYIIGGINKNISFSYLDSCMRGMAEYAESCSAKNLIIALPRPFISDAFIYLKNILYENIFIYDKRTGEFIKIEK